MAIPADWTERLTLPVIVAPMTAVSTPELAAAACRAGAIGSFPAHNTAGGAELEQWLDRASVEDGAPLAVNLVAHRSNHRLEADLATVVARKVDLVIASVGAPTAIVEPIHAYGGRVLADVATVRHAQRALAAGVDGLVLLGAGAGGQTGWLNPFAFVRAVREFFDGLLVLAGGIADGASIRAAETLGADLVFIGTRFIATHESGAAPAYKRAVVEASADDVVLSDRFTGLPTSLLAAYAQQATPLSEATAPGFDHDRLLSRRDVWSAGHGVSSTRDILHASEVLDALCDEYAAASR
jgi:nitronate monooxygenase